MTASQAILKGICPDGGLYVPNEIPKLERPLSEYLGMGYKDLAFGILKHFLNDFTDEELWEAINGAYDSKFDTPLFAPLKKAGDNCFLELFHGKTIAFKDMALSILPYLTTISARKNGEDKTIAILTATSGDTGKAALEGFADVPGTKIIVFFPEYGVSAVQKLQMTTQEGKNTHVCGILGNFDDAQTAVKKIFTDEALNARLYENGYVLSSANSINIGRLVPQVVYYFYAYLQMVEQNIIEMGEKINFTVPTGNFGNILAGYFAKCMGLPVEKLICASNDNKVLYDFFATGEYDKNREFFVTTSPSMDILVSSNLERLLYYCMGAKETAKLMQSLNSGGKYETSKKFEDFVGEYATEAENAAGIKELFESTGYVCDTHTGVACAAYKKYLDKTGDKHKNVIVSTASPYKFTRDVLTAINSKYANEDDFRSMDILEELSGITIPAPVRGLDKRPVLHKDVCEKDALSEYVESKLK
ncbi:MAG: threonine synthase [Firmicutes bacterium]|nr:threonine synthase [Bacillota bacterium]